MQLIDVFLHSSTSPLSGEAVFNTLHIYFWVFNAWEFMYSMGMIKILSSFCTV